MLQPVQSTFTCEISITNDSATILKSIQLDKAAVKIWPAFQKYKMMTWETGRLLFVYWLASCCARREKLVAAKIHLQTIVERYRITSQVALEALVFA
jgi:T-complex protein 1 subunit beta